MSLLCESAVHMGEPFRLMPWQVGMIRDVLGVRPDGKWAAADAAFLVGRQNGKGGVLHALELAGLFLFDDVREILHSAHEVKTAKKAYRELRELIKHTPHLYAQVERRGTQVVGFRQSNEDTSITLQDGSVVRFMARSTTSARGFSPQWLVIDEAQICSEDTRQALFYSTRAQKNPLRVWCGTVPTPRDNGEVFTALRDRGRAGGDPHLVWSEWSVDPDRTPESFRGDDDAVVMSCPSLGRMLEWETLDTERLAAVSDEAWLGFCRESLSWWPDATEEPDPWGVIPEAAWIAAASDRPMLDPVTLALEVQPDYGWSSILAAGATMAGEAVELVADRSGTDWIVGQLTALHERHTVRFVVVDPRSPASAFIDDLEAAGLQVVQPKTADVVNAAGALYVGITGGTVTRWPDQPTLDDAMAKATKRAIGDAWLIDRRTSPQVGRVVGASLALWGHRRPSESAPAPDFLIL